MLYFITEGSNIRIKDGDNDFKVLSNTSKCIDWTVYSDLIDLSIDETTFDGKNPTHIYFDGVASVDAAGVIASLKSMFTNLAGGGTSVVESATVTLTDAQIKALPTTFIEIIPSQGVGKVIFPQSAFIQKKFSNGAYGNIDTDVYLSLAWGDWLADATSFFKIDTDATDSFNVLSIYANVGNGTWSNFIESPTSPISTSENMPIKLIASNGGFGGIGDFTGGNAANTLKVTVYYTVVDL